MFNIKGVSAEPGFIAVGQYVLVGSKSHSLPAVIVRQSPEIVVSYLEIKENGFYIYQEAEYNEDSEDVLQLLDKPTVHVLDNQTYYEFKP